MRYFILFIALVASFSGNAQNIGKLFCNFNYNDFSLLSKEARERFINEYKQHGTDSIMTDNGRFFKMEVYDEANGYLKIRTSAVKTFEMKILTAAKDSFVVITNITTCAPLCDSNILIYDKHLSLITTDMFDNPSILDFIDVDKLTAEEKSTKKKNETVTNFIKKLTIIFNDIQIMPNEDKIILTNDFEPVLDKDIYAEIKPYLKGNALDYLWDGTSFKPQNAYWK